MFGYPNISMPEIIRRYNPGEGRHWFDEGSLTFFKTKLPGHGIETPHGNFFITAETNWSDKQAYSVRVQSLETGRIATVGVFHSYPTHQAARDALGEHLKELELLAKVVAGKAEA